MAEYIIEKLTGQTRVHEGTYKIFLFKIDKYGNTDIKTQHITSGLGGTQFCAFQSELSINDNIPVPNYLIETIQKLLHPDAETERQASYFDNAIQVIKQLKTSLKEMSNNPKSKKDTKTQLELSLNKNTRIESQLESSLNKNKLLETELRKMKQTEERNKYIQKTYSDDNEKLTEQITKLNEKIKTIENELKNTKTNAANITPRYGTVLQRTSTRQQEETG
jgi:vacuolar-type H+-ATPase subunit I/STV1